MVYSQFTPDKDNDTHTQDVYVSGSSFTDVHKIQPGQLLITELIHNTILFFFFIRQNSILKIERSRWQSFHPTLNETLRGFSSLVISAANVMSLPPSNHLYNEQSEETFPKPWLPCRIPALCVLNERHLVGRQSTAQPHTLNLKQCELQT